jgi:hypothetical protein
MAGSGAGEAPSIRWFKRLVWAGIVANIAVAVVTMAMPDQVSALLKLEQAVPRLWPRFAAFLLILLSLFYVAAARDPVRNAYSSLMAVIARLGTVAFFAIVGGNYIIFGLYDLIFGLPQALLLIRVRRLARAVDPMAPAWPPRRNRRWLVLAILALLAAALGWFAYDRLFREEFPSYSSDAEHFKYGSIGNDGAAGIPFAIWVALPRVFPEYLPGPGGYASLGLRWEDGRGPLQAPIGFSLARVGVDRISITCAVCHVTNYRMREGERLRFALGGPSNALDVLAYQRFLTAAVRDPRFSADVLLPAMADAGIDLSWLDRQLYRYVLIPATRKALLEQGANFAWTEGGPSWGPGRIDPFNPAKFDMLGIAVDGTIGNSDMQAIWGLGDRERLRPDGAFHWDGLNNSLREAVLSSALGDGAPAGDFVRWRPSADRIEGFLRRLRAPPSPHRPDGAAVSRGRTIFDAQCGACHAPGGARTLTVIPLAEIGTDRHRLAMWSPEAAARYTNYGRGQGFSFDHFRNLEGYAAETLDGLWLRGPYLHNGSVPTLQDLLEPPDRRPRAFVRGGELIDGRRGGFVAPACLPIQRVPGRFCHDTSLPGNGNGGHLYGTALPPGAKADLLAYLLTR